MVKIRLRRVGAKKKPSYRIVVADARAPRDGALIETIGHYNPLTDPPSVEINEEKALKWLRQGAHIAGNPYIAQPGLPWLSPQQYQTLPPDRPWHNCHNPHTDFYLY
jgi:small subunit ribosomal protein S16